jgi:hypothetical protein
VPRQQQARDHGDEEDAPGQGRHYPQIVPRSCEIIINVDVRFHDRRQLSVFTLDWSIAADEGAVVVPIDAGGGGRAAGSFQDRLPVGVADRVRLPDDVVGLDADNEFGFRAVAAQRADDEQVLLLEAIDQSRPFQDREWALVFGTGRVIAGMDVVEVPRAERQSSCTGNGADKLLETDKQFPLPQAVIHRDKRSDHQQADQRHREGDLRPQADVPHRTVPVLILCRRWQVAKVTPKATTRRR